MSETRVKLSVVIGFKDWGLDRLVGAVRSIGSSLRGIPSEVIIADYGSANNEGYQSELESFGAIYRYIPTDGIWSRSRALNAGLEISQGEYLVTTDADMVFSPSTFTKILELLEGEPRTSFILQCRDLPEGITHDDILKSDLDWEWLDSKSRLRPRWGMGGMIAFDRNAYESLRGLDERMQIYGGEDIDLAKRLLRIGYKRHWIEDPAVRMYHVWHPSSRTAADETEAGRVAIQTNRAIQLNDLSRVRNLNHWEGRPESADPLVTVAISTFNRAEYLDDSINSVIGQTFEDWELIIVNDGSTDNTREVLAQFEDPRIRVIHQENRGLAAARNRITAEARGRYIAVHDDDDIMLPWSLEVRLQALTGGVHGSYGGWIDYENSTGNRTYNIGKKLSIESLLFNRATYLHPTLLVETRVMRAIPYDETMRSGSDFNLAARMVRSGVKLNHSTHYVLLRRLHEGQITNSDSTLQKVSGVITNFVARSTMTLGEIEEMRGGRQEKDKAIIAVGQQAAESYIIPFLPDHLVSREVTLSKDVPFSEVVENNNRSDLMSFWRHAGADTAEVAFDNRAVDLKTLFHLYQQYGEKLTIRAHEKTDSETSLINAEPGGARAVSTASNLTIKDWMVERLSKSEAGVYLAVRVGENAYSGTYAHLGDDDKNLVGYKSGHKVYRLDSVDEVSALLKAKAARQGGKPAWHLIMEKGA